MHSKAQACHAPASARICHVPSAVWSVPRASSHSTENNRHACQARARSPSRHAPLARRSIPRAWLNSSRWNAQVRRARAVPRLSKNLTATRVSSAVRVVVWAICRHARHAPANLTRRHEPSAHLNLPRTSTHSCVSCRHARHAPANLARRHEPSAHLNLPNISLNSSRWNAQVRSARDASRWTQR